jgi:hypothetical protein
MNITRVSVDSAGNQGNQSSIFLGSPSISPDGRFVAFVSAASNLVPGDTNASDDIFVRDTLANTTIRVSVDSAGNQANMDSYTASISAGGRFVAFWSKATNLVPGDTNADSDVFVRDMLANTTTRVSVDSVGNQADESSLGASISPDGRFVAFLSFASNLVPGDTNNNNDIFVRDLLTNTITRVSVDSAGNQANSDSLYFSISANGQRVAFDSAASNLVPGDTNNSQDIFVRNTLTNTTTRVSVDSAGNQGNSGSGTPSISADGRFVAFFSFATNLVPGGTNNTNDIFVRDTLANTTARISVDSAGNQANGTFGPNMSISSDGRFVAFESTASNLVPGDTNNYRDIFVRDLLTNTTTRVSVDSAGNQGNNGSFAPSISSNGQRVAFDSAASNLVPGDTNSIPDVFVSDIGSTPGNKPPDNNINGILGNDNLTSTSGNDIINGVQANDVLIGLRNNDVFVLGAGLEVDTIADFAKSQDTVQLINSLTFGQLSISRGTEAPLIKVAGNGEVLASLIALLLISLVLKISSRSRV